MGRNPGMPWKKQSDLITIDPQRDYITDRGDEVWKILERNAIKNVILTGVHLNMCVLGRPFGLRQMVRNEKHVVLMRDMTDSMYSPQSWPYVDHFTGHDRVLAYLEEHICPTITSDQFLGGEPFRWKADQHTAPTDNAASSQPPYLDIKKRWVTVDLQSEVLQNALKNESAPVWYRGAILLSAENQSRTPMDIELPDHGKTRLWLNGQEVHRSTTSTPQRVRFTLPTKHITPDDYNLIVVKSSADATVSWRGDFIVDGHHWEIEPLWQVRVGEDPRFMNITLPAKFGIGPDAVLGLRKTAAK